MTTYGPYKRVVIRTNDAIITITGTNMIATVTDYDDSTTPQGSEVSHAGTSERDDSLELGSPHIGESSSTVDHQLSASSDMESVSVSEEMQEMVCDSQTTDDNSGQSSDIGLATGRCASADDSKSEQGTDMECVSVSEKIVCQSHPTIMDNVDSDLDQPSDIISITDECGSLDHSGSEQDGASPSNPISGDEYIVDSDSDTNSGLQLQLQSTRKKQPLKKNTHSHEKKTYSCNVCGKTFAQSWHLSQHIRVHTGERPYSCSTCGKTFAQSGHLLHHIRVHTGERPYSCHTCGKTFVQSGHLSYHIRVHTGERPYSCDTCGKTFSQSGDLSRHVRVHTGERPYSCDTCGKVFARSGDLSRHIRVHTGEKPYSCDTCGKMFALAGTLSRHIRVHTGERPYSCNTCGKTFTRSGHLTKHVRSCAH